MFIASLTFIHPFEPFFFMLSNVRAFKISPMRIESDFISESLASN